MVPSPMYILIIHGFLISLAPAARILGVFPLTSRSHVVLGSELLKGLIRRGHEVTMLSAFPLQEPFEHYTDIAINLSRLDYDVDILEKAKWIPQEVLLARALCKVSVNLFEDPSLSEFIKSDQQFDAIIFNDCGIDSIWGMAHKFNSTMITLSTMAPHILTSYMLGFPIPSSYVPMVITGFSTWMNFWERFNNYMANLMALGYLQFWNKPVQDALLRANFPGAPSLQTFRESIDIHLSNTHIAVDPIRPMFPNMISIGGFYMKNLEVLPDDIKKFLDTSKRGVIVMSFGSNLRSSNMNHQVLGQLVDFMRNSKFDILWNFDKNLPNMGRNVKIVNFLPQRAILAHTNVKIFIHHGGRGSVNEAIYYGVPMIIVPFYLDQHMNARYCSDNKLAIKLDKVELTSRALGDAVAKIMSDDIYKRNIQTRSEIFRNQDVDPMEKAIYWIEFAMKNRDAKFLKTPATSLPWYQRESYDVLTLILILIVFLSICLKYLCRYTFRYLRIGCARIAHLKQKMA